MAITSSTSKVERPDIPEGEEDGEESDEYEVVDEEGEEEEENEDEEDEEDEEESGGGLTALLLNSHGDVEDDEDKGWVPGGGREPADYSGDEDDDEHVLEGSKVQSDKPPSKNAVPSQSMGKSGETANGSGKKRARELEEESTEEQNGKKTKKV